MAKLLRCPLHRSSLSEHEAPSPLSAQPSSKQGMYRFHACGRPAGSWGFQRCVRPKHHFSNCTTLANATTAFTFVLPYIAFPCLSLPCITSPRCTGARAIVCALASVRRFWRLDKAMSAQAAAAAAKAARDMVQHKSLLTSTVLPVSYLVSNMPFPGPAEVFSGAFFGIEDGYVWVRFGREGAGVVGELFSYYTGERFRCWQ